MGGRVMSRNDPLSCGNNPTVSRVAARHNHRSVVAVTRYDEVACLDLALLAGLQVIHRIPAIRSVAQAHVSLKESCSQRGGADLPGRVGAYLAGYLAAGVSQTGKVATFGGGNQPPVTLFMDGFVDGVAKYNEVHGTAVVALGWDKATQDGVFTGDFEDINTGLTPAQAFIDQGADVILPVAGLVGEGAARAALDSGTASIIWVDSDGYDTLSPDFRPVLLTSVLKNTGSAVVEIVKTSIDDTFDNAPFIGTLENGGVGIAPFHDLAPRVSAELSAEIDQLRSDIVAGTIVVTSPSTPR